MNKINPETSQITKREIKKVNKSHMKLKKSIVMEEQRNYGTPNF
jgi:hypothetical protein